ncbi:MAG: ABC transporter ATP-binding protein/permease [Lachnospiraceae bacterium]|nr:ABC transporter ATP-binding protein/permease [Lachnospiraceae bacterium]
MKKLIKYVLKHRFTYIFAILCLFIGTIADNIRPQLIKDIVDEVIEGGKPDLLPRLLISIAAIGLLRTFTQYFKEFLFDITGVKVGNEVRFDLFKHIQKLSLNYFDKANTGELLARLKNDIDSLAFGGVGFIIMLAIEILLHTGIVIYCMFGLSPKLAIFPLCVLPFGVALAIVLEKKLDTVYDNLSEENAEMNTVAQEDIAGVRTVKAFSRENYELEKFRRHNKKYYELSMKLSKVLVRYEPLFDLITRILPIGAILIGGRMVISGDISLGTLTAFVAYCDMLVWPMECIGWVSNEIASAFASYKKIKKVANEVPMIEAPADPVVLPEVKGSVEFDNVTFTLDNKDILKDISFSLPAGKTLGIMGATGSGKTSILTLLFRFYDANKGTVKLDGVDVKDLSLTQLRQSIAQVSQDVFLFSDTISENVRFGKHEGVSDEVVRKCLEMAQATEFVDNLSEKEETVIGERGVGLSGGQKQRISIARALAKNAPILVLDDSTSALDTETELEIQGVLNSLTDTTKIIIGHRISAVRKADEIIVLKDGAIAERGTHEELLALRGLYYETYCAQYGEVA